MNVIVFTCSMAVSFSLAFWQKKKETLDFKFLFYIFIAFILFLSFCTQQNVEAVNDAIAGMNLSEGLTLSLTQNSSIIIAIFTNIIFLISSKLFGFLNNWLYKDKNKFSISKYERIWLYILALIFTLLKGYLLVLNNHSEKNVFTPYVIAFLCMIVIQMIENIGSCKDFNNCISVIKTERKMFLYSFIIFILFCIYEFNSDSIPLTMIDAMCIVIGYLGGIVIALNPV
ncbi:hypothetical protein BXO88_06595 [Oribacterium sp. C9]|uniref:hypothetical protein n=1 Tax=Oribacterium sp. C9 TaxID=1943579 RepID=UPI00098FAED7|nr:hypothetical protein [Oribacterium sp. C9]OON86659.1 hypothetical protein BXO88_06595 [Oribacterium sp. C9]